MSYASVQKMPEHLDEIAVAGALAGAPINVVRAKTVDLLVPAEAEIVIEGFIDTEWLEPEAPFGESHGYVNLQEYNAFMEVTAITRRRQSDPHLVHQPGDAQRIERDPQGGDGAGLSRITCAIGARHQRRQARGHARAADQPLRGDRGPVRARHARDRSLARALRRATLHRFAGKWIIAVDEDIDPENADALFWAMSYRCQPQHDIAGVRAQGPRPRAARTARRRRKRRRADQRDAQGRLSRRSRCRSASSWSTRRRSGSGSACRRLSRRRPGTAMISAIGRRSLERQAEMAARSEYFELGKELSTNGAATSP